jgi:Chaperone of endosialidase
MSRPVAAALMVVLGTPFGPSRPALADNVVADDQIVQGNLCVGTPCVNGESFFSGGEVKIRGIGPFIRLEDTDTTHFWDIDGVDSQFAVQEFPPGTTPFSIASGAPSFVFRIAADGKVAIGTGAPSQPLHVRKNQDANTFLLVQNATNGVDANAVVRTQADVAMQNFQSHATSRTLVRWGTPLGGWNEFLSVVGTGLAMGTLGNAPMILGTSSAGRMRLDGASNVIDFAGGGQYNGANFLDASSRARKQDIQPLEPEVAKEALAGLAPVTYAYVEAPGEARVGFIAEDVPALVARPGRTTLSALEIVAVLTKVVQEQQAAMQEQQAAMREQQKALREQLQAIAELTARLAALETRP